ncbi:MAG TPA: phage holin family protein [Opitutus sp.]|nr:phage holin family protein [Opitutus sp.]
MNSDPSQPNSIIGLLQNLRDDTTTLLRQEVALAKAELKTNASQVGRHAAEIAVGGFVAYAGMIVLLIGLGQLIGVGLIRAGLDPDIAQWLAPTLVGLAIGLIGWLMLAKAKRALAHDTLAPRQTIESLKTDKQWAQNKLHPSHESNT